MATYPLTVKKKRSHVPFASAWGKGGDPALSSYLHPYRKKEIRRNAEVRVQKVASKPEKKKNARALALPCKLRRPITAEKEGKKRGGEIGKNASKIHLLT